jgi:UDP:flavonoid glycosyltransferase YjiC (YdhE family)
MARFLAYTSPARGHLYPIVPTLLELRRRGHEVHVRTLASEVAALEPLGLRAEPIDPAIEARRLDDWAASAPPERLANALRTFADRAVHEVPDLERAIARVGPDALLVDVTTAGAAALAEAGPLPWAQSIPFFEHICAFGRNEAGIAALNEPRRRLGLAPLAGAAEIWRAPLHLYYTAPPFAGEELDLPPSFRMVGPGIWEPPAAPPAWLGEVEGPLVLVSASSEFQRDDALIETALAALRPEPVHVVVTSAAHDPQRFDAPPNATLARWAPHGPLLARASCVVCHGGMGVTQKALAAGVPVCVVPFGRDQFVVAETVARAGAGTRVLPGELDAASLRAAIREAMTMRAGAERIAAGFARAGGPTAAAAALEALLAGRAEAALDGAGQPAAAR